jgi:hypothetical protein
MLVRTHENLLTQVSEAMLVRTHENLLTQVSEAMLVRIHENLLTQVSDARQNSCKSADPSVRSNARQIYISTARNGIVSIVYTAKILGLAHRYEKI